jgi:Protein of unknown function (DUF995)
MLMLRRILIIAAIASGLGTVTSGAIAAPASADAQATTPLTHKEIYKIYGQKSWIWKDGAGYFSVRKRSFTAWSEKSDAASYGVGRWFITGPGKLCFRADWHAKSGSALATTCFSHRKNGRVIFQKREPDGKWYVFRNAPAKTGDEFAKLRYGNYVDARLSRIEARIGGRE